MQEYTLETTEKQRRAAVAQYAIFKSEPDKDYDQLTYLAAEFCQVPVATISIIGKKEVWYKSVFGTKEKEINRKNSFCDLCLNSQNEIFSINYSDNSEFFDRLNPHYENSYQFYTGVRLINPKGFTIAILSIFDTKPRKLSQKEENVLKALGNQCINLFESRKQRYKLHHIQRRLKQKYKDLEKFASLVSHDIKSPLANMISLTELLKEENAGKFDEETTQYLDFLVESSYSLRNYVDGILTFYRSDHVLEKDYENVELPQMLKKITDLYSVSDDISINYPKEGRLDNVNKTALTQVFMNLISNALKYNKQKHRVVDISFKKTESYYHFEVADNGMGIPKKNLEQIFELFSTLDVPDRDGNPGSGIGLATVKKHIENMQGDITVSSEPGKGSNFKFRIKRL